MLSVDIHMNSKDKRNRRSVHYGWYIVLGSFILMILSYGVRYSFGIYLIPLCTDLNWTREVTSGVFSIYMLVYSISCIIVGKLADIYGPRMICVVGVALIGTGLLLSGCTTKPWHLYVGYGIFAALGGGAISISAITTITRFFLKKKELALGFACTGVGLGLFISSPLAHKLISSYGWSLSFILTGFVVIIVGFPTAFIILRRNPESVGLTPYGTEEEGIESAKGLDSSVSKDVTLGEALRIRQFWMLGLTYLLFSSGLLGAFAHIVAYSTDRGIDPFLASAALGLIGIFYIGGATCSGIAGESIGKRKILVLILMGQAALMFTLRVVAVPVLLYVWVSIFGSLFGGISPILVGLTTDMFGRKAIGTLFGFITILGCIGGAFGPWFGGYVFDVRCSYDIAFCIFGILASLGSICAYFSYPLTK